MTTPISPVELDATALIIHAARQGVSFESYIKRVARNARVKIKKVSEGVKDFEDVTDIGNETISNKPL